MICREEAIGGPGQSTETAPFCQAQDGCRDSLNRLMAAHENLVHTVVRRQALGIYHLPMRCRPVAWAYGAPL